MLNRIRERFGTAGLVVSIMALVLALAGGAFAASGGLNAKQKKQVKAIAKGLVPTGPVGPAGANGAKGDTGAAGVGTKGDPGDPGKSVTGTPIAAAGACGAQTGVKYSLDGTDTNVCNGANGQTGFTATLPANSTETGTWAGNIENNSFSSGVAAISFAIPLASTHLAVTTNTHVKVINSGDAAPPECNNGAAPDPSAANPEADSGYLCVFGATGLVYADGLIGNIYPPDDSFAALKVAPVGGVAAIGGSDGEEMMGSFAVTG